MRTEASQRDCPRFDRCSVILCPMAPREYLTELRGFLPEEDEVCGRKELARHPLVIRQRRLQRAGARGLFTALMIESLGRIARGLEGLRLEDSYGTGPDEKAREWVRSHTRKRQVSDPAKRVA